MKRSRIYQLIGVAVITLCALFTAHDDAGISGISGRLATIQSIGERGVFFIENSSFRSVDKVKFEQHIYSDKPQLPQLIFGVVYRTARSFGAPEFAGERARALYWINLFFAVTVNGMIFLWLFNALRRFKYGGVRSKFLLSLLCVCGSWLLSYGTIYNNHNLTALAILGILVSVQKMQRKPTLTAAFLCGVSAGFAGNFELPAGLFCGVAAVVAAAFTAPGKRRIHHFAVCAAGGAVMLLGFLLINYYASRSFLPLYLVAGGTYSAPEVWKDGYFKYAVDALFWTRGLFSYQPFLLLGVWYVLRHCKKLGAAYQSMLVCIAGLMIFYIFFTNEYGGWGYGFRYYIQLIPVLWFFASCWLLEHEKSKARKSAAAVLIAVGVITGAVGTFAPYAVAYEGPRTPDGHFTEKIQSTFCGNLLSMVYRYAPESKLFSMMRTHYGAKATDDYLLWSFLNRNIPDKRLGITERNETLRRILRK